MHTSYLMAMSAISVTILEILAVEIATNLTLILTFRMDHGQISIGLLKALTQRHIRWQ